MKTIGFYPAIQDRSDQADLLARSTWYLWPWREKIGSIRMWGLAPAPAVSAADGGLDPAIDAQYPDILPLIASRPGNDEEASVGFAAEPVDLLFIWRAPRTDREQALADRAEAACRKRGGIVKVVDPRTAMNEGSLYLWGCLQALGEEQAHVEECKIKYEALKSRRRHPNVCIFGTGPSLAQLAGYDFSNTDSIVCNSIVANEALLDRANPIAIVAGDPIFHAGCSQYAAEFRSKLRHVLETRDICFVTVMRDYVQQLAQLPRHVHHKVIAIPFAPDGAPFHFDLDNSFHIAPEGNVLSLLLFPLGAALYERITVCGCDGRPLAENTYFWPHDKASQLSKEKMGNIQVVHPAFFVRSYDDHYSEHVATVSRIVEILEEAGKRIHTLTPSHIPALASRQCFETLQLPGAEAARHALIVSVNPDATDDYGHWIWYDRRLAEQAKRRGADFVSLANTKLRQDIRVREGHYRAVFDHETWGAGNQKMKDIDLVRLVEFEATLNRQISELAEEYPGQDRVYYLYTGSLPHALAMYRLARKHPDEFFVINTFWTCVMDCLAENYVGRWGEFLREAQEMPNLRIFSITKQLKRIFREEAGVNLALMPHPTPSLAGPRPPQSRAGKPFRVLFPGGMTEQKGFADVPRILAQIRTRPVLDDAEVIVRATETEGVIGDERREIVGQIKVNAEFVTDVMDDKTFLDWLSSADLAVLPYRRKEWVYRNSALLVDLLYLGVPVVCARGTWLSDVIDQLGGGIAVDGDDPAAYAAAIETVRRDREGYVLKAVDAAKRYDAANSWNALADSMLAILQDPAARGSPPKRATADEAAPINWWRKEERQPARPPASPRQEGRAASPGEALSFAFTYLTRSTAVIAGWSFAAVCVVLSNSSWAVLQPIRTHLLAVAIVSLAGGGAFTLARYISAHRKGILHRLARRALLHDVAMSIAEAIMAPGMLRNGVIILTALAALVWSVTYALRLNGAASQGMLDLAFWAGTGIVLGVTIVGAGLRSIRLAARRVLTRFGAGLLATARKESVQLADVVARDLEAHRSEAEARLVALRDLAALTNRRLTHVAARQKAGDARIEQLTEMSAALDGSLDLARRRADELHEALGAVEADIGGQVEALDARSGELSQALRAMSSDLNGRLETLDANLASATAGVETLGESISVAGDSIDGISAAVDKVGAMMQRLEESMERVGSEGKAFDEQLGAMKTSFAHLEIHARDVEAKLDAVRRDRNTLEREVYEMQDRLKSGVTGVERNVAEIGERFTSLGRHVVDVEGQVAVVRRDRNTLETEVLEMQKRVSGINAYTDELTSNASALYSRVNDVETRTDMIERNAIRMRDTVGAIESSGFHVVSRYVPHDDLDRLAKDLSRAFEIELTAPILGYAAHGVRQLEAKSLGRIAAPMTDILVRIAALMAVKRREASVLEIGTLFGIGALAMRTVCRQKFDRVKLTFLDPLAGYYSGDYGPPLIDLWTGVPVNRDTLEQNIRIAEVPPEDASILQFYSENPDALALASAERYDVLIIDGDHSYDGVMRDYTDYAPLVRKNGFVIFDDYDVPEWSGVTKAANEILDDGTALQRVFFDGKTLVCRVRGTLAQARPRAPLAIKQGGAS